MRKHILITGERGIGKSTLLRALLKSNTRPLAGFYTKRLDPDETGFHPIYIHPAAAMKEICSEENLIGTCNSKIHHVNSEVFETLGCAYLQASTGQLIVMDELGFMEAKSERFCSAVKAALDGDIPVIAILKNRTDIPFLMELRAHPNAEVYTLTEENRDAVRRQLEAVLTSWNREC